MLRSGERLVRRDGTLKFGGSKWQIPTGWAAPGEYLMVGFADFWGTKLWVAPPGYTSFGAAMLDCVCTKIKPIQK